MQLQFDLFIYDIDNTVIFLSNTELFNPLIGSPNASWHVLSLWTRTRMYKFVKEISI